MSVPAILAEAAKASSDGTVNLYASIAGGVTGLLLLGLFSLAKRAGMVDRLQQRIMAKRREEPAE